MRLLLASFVVALLAAGCSSKSSNSSTAGPCNPLAPPPTSLTNVVGAGKDATGKVYVLDEPRQGYGYRLLVTSGSSLVREHVSGSGETGTGDGTMHDSVEFTDPGADTSTTQTLFFDTTSDRVTSMALGSDDASSGQKGGVPNETLTLVDSSGVSGLTVVNLPRTVWTLSDVSDGSVLLLTLAGDDGDDGEGSASAALFYGPPGHVQQAAIDHLSQSGTGDIYVSFTIGQEYDGHIANGVIPTESNASYSPPAFDTIDVPGKGTETLSERKDPSLAGMSFVCN